MYMKPKIDSIISCSLTSTIIILLLGVVIGATLLCSCSKTYITEGFEPIKNEVINPYLNKLYNSLENNVGGKIPLPEDTLNFFYANKFTPECCQLPQQYSNSSGCACISIEQMKYLNYRGGNNTRPHSKWAV